MAQFIDMGKISENGAKLEYLANVKLRNKLDDLLRLMNSTDWTGSARDKYFSKYEASVSKLYKMCDDVTKLGKFLNVASVSYDEVNMKVNNNFQETDNRIVTVEE